MNMQSIVWCSTSPSALKNSAFTSGLPADEFHAASEAWIASMTSARAWAYRAWTRPSRWMPWESTRCCVASGTSLSDRGLQRCAGSVQPPARSMPSTHASNTGRPLSAGPENTRQASVFSGRPARSVARRSYCQYASEDTPASSRYSSWHRCTSEPEDESPADRHWLMLSATPAGIAGSP